MNAPTFVTSAFVRAPERFMIKGGRWKIVDIPVRFGLWSAATGPILIDTGYGPNVFAKSTILKVYNAVLGVRLLPEYSIECALARKGFRSRDVNHVVITHFHADHISELKQLPHARFIGSGTAYDKLMKMPRYQQLRHGFFAELLPQDFNDRFIPVESLGMTDAPFGLGPGYDIFDNGSCLAIPLPGHALGHLGLVWPRFDPPLLHAVDTQWMMGAIERDRMPGFPADLVGNDRQQVHNSTNKVRMFKASGGHIVLTHDPHLTRWDDS